FHVSGNFSFPSNPRKRMIIRGASVATELRCQCLQTLQGIHPKNIQSVNVKSPGPHCAQTEVIATLKNGQKACLNPASPIVKKIIEKMLNSGKSN
uniref:C-X-C motif chemokine n=1 Tax=Nomascus leucogenys TaxID=61853 RepID=A0A2I3HUY2_NOMLE